MCVKETNKQCQQSRTLQERASFITAAAISPKNSALPVFLYVQPWHRRVMKSDKCSRSGFYWGPPPFTNSETVQGIRQKKGLGPAGFYTTSCLFLMERNILHARSQSLNVAFSTLAEKIPEPGFFGNFPVTS